MKDSDKQKAAQAFADKWRGRGDEKQDTQSFWIELFQKVFGVADATDGFKFEYRVKRESVSGKRDKTTNFIDALIPKTKVLIEQKSNDINLDNEYQQSDKQALTPFAQAMQYNAWLPADLRAKWIVVCNFEEFRIHDLNDPMADPAVVKLADLADKFHAFDFMVDENVDTVTVEEAISVKAGELVGKLYDCFLKQYPEEDRNAPPPPGSAQRHQPSLRAHRLLPVCRRLGHFQIWTISRLPQGVPNRLHARGLAATL